MDFKGKIVYDIGAYIGLLTVFFAKRVGEKGRVITFEPNPDNFSKLLVNTARYQNVVPFNLGAGNNKGEMIMIASVHSRATATVEQTMKLERVTHAHKKWAVQVVPIDALKKLPPPDFVKIDVEGFEYSVLEGMRNTILFHRPALFIELHGVTDAMKKENMQKIVQFLYNLGYELFSVEMQRKVSSSCMPLKGHVFAYHQSGRHCRQN